MGDSRARLGMREGGGRRALGDVRVGRERVVWGGEPGERGRVGVETCGESLCAAAWGDGGGIEDEVWELELDVCGESVLVEVVVWRVLVLVLALVGLEVAGERHRWGPRRRRRARRGEDGRRG